MTYMNDMAQFHRLLRYWCSWYCLLLILLSNPTSGIAQNVPSLNLPLLDYSQSFRQSVCDRQQAYANGTVEFRNALMGLELSVWLAVGDTVTELEADGSIPEVPGLTVEFLDELALRAGFEWRNSYGATNLSDINGIAFDDVLDWTVRSFDVSATVWTRTRSRIERGASFPQGVVDASIIMISKVQTEDDA